MSFSPQTLARPPGLLLRMGSTLSVPVVLMLSSGCGGTGGTLVGSAGSGNVNQSVGGSGSGPGGTSGSGIGDSSSAGNAPITTGSGGAVVAGIGAGGNANNAGGSANSTGGNTSGGGSDGSGTSGASAGGSVNGSGGSGSGGTTSTMLCPPTALICEDFEDGNLDGWTEVLTSGTLVIDSQQATSGMNALSINVPPDQRGGFIEMTGAPLFPLPNQVMWGRVMVYFESVSDGHTDFVRGATANGGTPWYNVGEQTGDVLLNYYNGADFDCWARPAGGTTLPLATWMCFEWSFDGNLNEMQFFIDGDLSRAVSATGDGCLSGNASIWEAPEFGALQIGQYIAETRPTEAQMWIDDIAVGTEARIGCPPLP